MVLPAQSAYLRAPRSAAQAQSQRARTLAICQQRARRWHARKGTCHHGRQRAVATLGPPACKTPAHQTLLLHIPMWAQASKAPSP